MESLLYLSFLVPPIWGGGGGGVPHSSKLGVPFVTSGSKNGGKSTAFKYADMSCSCLLVWW